MEREDFQALKALMRSSRECEGWFRLAEDGAFKSIFSNRMEICAKICLKLRLNTRLKRDMATYEAEPEFKTEGIQLVVSANNIGEFDVCQKRRPTPRKLPQVSIQEPVPNSVARVEE
jgi:hypothetical protein